MVGTTILGSSGTGSGSGSTTRIDDIPITFGSNGVMLMGTTGSTFGTGWKGLYVDEDATASLEDVTLSLPASGHVQVWGDLEADGATFQGNGGTWNGITFNSGSSGTIESSTIEDVASYSAIYITNTAVTLDGDQLDNPGSFYGVYVQSSGSSATIHHTDITGSSHGVGFSSTGHGSLYDDVIDVAGNAVAAYYYSDPYLRPYPYHEGGSNELGHAGSSGYGIYAGYSATVYAGDDPSYYGNNDFCYRTSYDAVAYAGASIEAERNRWPRQEPYVSGSVDYTPVINQQASCSGVAGKRGAPGTVAEVGAVSSLDERTARAVELMHRAARDGGAPSQSLFDEAAALLKGVRSETTGTPAADAALVALFRLARLQQTHEQRAYFEDQAQTSGPDRASALGLLVQAYQYWGDEAAARRAAETLIRLYPDTWHAFYAGLSLFEMDFGAGDFASAAGRLEGLVPRGDFEEERLAEAWSRLGVEAGTARFRPAREPAEGARAADVASPAPSVDVYPNPFNPATTVRLGLAADAFAEVAVYDALGRRVATLWRGPLAAGRHGFAWDASGRASGTYFVVLRTGRRARPIPIVLAR